MGDVQTVIEDEPATDRPHTLVVAVSNPDHVEQLMRTAVDVATDRGGEIRIVSVVHKHASSPFLLFSDDRIKREFSDGRAAVLEEAVAVAERASVPVQRSLLVGSDVSDAILAAVEDAGADALLLGWQERARPSDIVLGTTVDPVLRRAPCDVFVERIGTTTDTVDDILLPTDGGPHVEAATDLAGAIARANDATVTVASYLPWDATEADRETAIRHVHEASGRLADVPTKTDVHETDAVADAIVAAAADRDIVVMGATRERRFQNRVVGSVAETVGQRVPVPVIIARRRTSGSLLERALERLR